MKSRASLLGYVVRGCALLVAAVAMAGCASDPLPSPVITSLKPSSATAGGPSFTLKVIGTGFLSTDVVLWNAAPLATQPVSSTELDAQVPSTLIQSAVIAKTMGLMSGVSQSQAHASQAPADKAVLVIVFRKDGSQQSNPMTFTITSATPAPDFSISASPSSQTVTAGGNTTYTATVNALNGFTGTVTLSMSGLPSGASGSLTPTSVTGSGTSMLAVTTASTTPAGTSTLTITGTSGSLVHSTTVSLVVNAAAAPDFSISASPSSQTVTAGGNTTYTATVSALNGFTGTVSLSLSGQPSGANGSFNPASVAGSGTSTLTVTTASTTPAGTSTLTITGTSGNLTHSTTATLVVNAAAMAGVIQQVTTSTTGESFLGGSLSFDPLISFSSTATDLVPNDTNGKPDVFVACVPGGALITCPAPIARVSLTSLGGQIPGGADAGPAPTQGQVSPSPISGDGRFVAFASSDPNVVTPPTPNNGGLFVYVRDTCFGAVGCAPTTFVVSLSSTGFPGNGHNPTLSANGRVVAFPGASGLVPGAGGFQIYARDTCFAAPAGCVPSTVLISADNSGVQGSNFSDHPSASGDGRFVAFESNSNNLVPTASSIPQQIFLRDTCIGAPPGCIQKTTLISVNSTGSASNSFNQSPSVNSDGRFVVFFSQASDILLGNTTSGRPDVFLRDTCAGSSGPVAGCTPSTTRVSVALDGTQANNASFTGGVQTSISATGRFIAFFSGATNLLPTPSTPAQVYVLDTCFGGPAGCTRALHKVTVDSNGNEVGSSGEFALSGDGKFLAFTQLVGTAPNQIQQIFLALTGF